MRNLKRALSLALASVMLLGMMVVGTSAASYPDVKDSDNVEAIEVLNAVGVMIGKKGKFDPDAPVNRHEMAAIMARLVLGEDAETYVGNHPFTDVYPWADKYVAACYENGIINGTSKTTFSGNQPLTAIQAATMMLRALGYEHLTKGASDWRVPVASQANKIGLFRGVTSSPSAQLTRNQVAQLALNTLESDMVDFTGELGWEINGVSMGTRLEWTPRKDLNNNTNGTVGYNYTRDPAGTTTHQKEYLQLCEDLYDGKLIKNTHDHDDFDRPATKWTYNGKVIGSYMNTPDLTYTKAVKLGDIYKDLGLGETVTADKVSFSRNGVEEDVAVVSGKELKDSKGTSLKNQTLSKGESAKIGDKGVLTQVWWNSSTETAEITMIDTYVGEVNTVVKATSSAARYVTMATDCSFPDADYHPWTTLDNKFESENFESEDLVIFTAAYSDSGKFEIKTMEALELTATAVLTRWEGENVVNSDKGTSDAKFTAGETYEYSANYKVVDEDGSPIAISGFDVNKSEINIYLDKYGYAIYVSGVEGETNYAAVIGIGSSNTHGSETKGVTLLLADGTQKSVTAKSDDWDVMTIMTYGGSYNTPALYPATDTTHKNLVGDGVADLVTYSIGSDGIYKLSLVGAKTLKNVDNDPDHTTVVYSGKYDMTINSTDTSNNSFINGKSLMEIKGLYDGNYTGTGGDAYGVNVGAAKGTYYTTSKTIFMVATQKKADPYDGRNYDVYVGYENAPSFFTTSDAIHGIAFATNKQYTNQIDVVYIDAVKMAGVAGADTYFVKDGSNIITNSDGKYYELPAVVKGEMTTILLDAQTWLDLNYDTNKDANEDAEHAPKGVYAVKSFTKNSKGIIDTCDLVRFDVDPARSTPYKGVGTVKDRDDVLGILGNGNITSGTVTGATYWSYTSDVKVYYVDKDWNLSDVGMNGVQTDEDDRVYAMFDDNTAPDRTKKLTHVFIKEFEPSIYAVGASANVQFSTDGTNWSNSLSGLKSADTIYIKAAAGYKVTSAAVSALGLGSPDGDGIYSIAAKDIAAGAVATEVDNASPVYATGVNANATATSTAKDELNLKNTTYNSLTGTAKMNVVDGISIATQIKNMLAAQGYTLDGVITDDTAEKNYVFSVIKDDMKSTIKLSYGAGATDSSTDQITEWYPVTVNGGATPVAYIKSGTNATNVPVAKPATNAGTGLMIGTTYTAYASTNKYTVTGANNAVDIKTGYRAVTLTVTDTELAAAFTINYAIGNGSFSATAPDAVKVGDVLKIKLIAKGAGGLDVTGTPNAKLDTGAAADSVVITYAGAPTSTGSFTEGASNVWTVADASSDLAQNDYITVTYDAMAHGTSALTIAPDWTDKT